MRVDIESVKMRDKFGKHNMKHGRRDVLRFSAGLAAATLGFGLGSAREVTAG